jgi:hypothetical protein
MKRYLVFPLDFDTRAHFLDGEQDHWEQEVKDICRENRERLVAQLRDEFGSFNFDGKLKNFKDMGPAPFSLISYHNRFFAEVRHSFGEFGSE